MSSNKKSVARTSTPANLPRCSTCKKTYRTSEDLKRHVEGVHEKKEQTTCPYCLQKFRDIYVLKNHIRDRHANDNKYLAWPCPVCAINYATKDARDTHRIEDHEQLLYDCDDCGEIFGTEGEWDAHLGAGCPEAHQAWMDIDDGIKR